MECSVFSSQNGALSDRDTGQKNAKVRPTLDYNREDTCMSQQYESIDAQQDSLAAHPRRIKPDSLLASMALPCQSYSGWDYDECYSYYANGCYNTCQFVEMGDMEDFMNNEKRKEKSRDAARSRRSKETEVFTDLASALPVPLEQVSQLDKASVMRLAIAYLRVRDMVNLVPEVPEPDDHKILVDDSIFMKSLEGFLLVLSSEGDIVYMSENVSEYLGISQIDLMGQNIFEYSHLCDHDEIKEILGEKTREESDAPKSFFIRLKCTLTNKGRSVNLKSATYKVIHCTGHIVHAESSENDESSAGCLRRCLVAIGKPIPHPSNIEAPLPRQTFLTKHSLDMKFTHADDKIMMDVLGYDSEDLVGQSVYEYHHATDSDSICSAFKCLFSKGQCETNRYRFLAKTGGYVWVLTQATLIYDNKTMKPQSVVCVNYVISGVECKDDIYSTSQLASVKTENLCNNNNIEKPIVPVVVVEKVATEAVPVNKIEQVKTSAKLPPYAENTTQRPPTLTATSKIFAPRTEEMNKGFLTFSEDEPGLAMLKDEPDDLTHLAPVAGDVCVPLDDHPFLTDMFDDFLLRDSFGPLLTDEPTDPFISYRDSYDNSPQLLSPNISKNSDCSLPSLNSPSDSLSDEDRLSTFMNLHTEDESDLVAKAPYITMNMGDDLPLLMSEDLMWNSNEKSKSPPDTGSSLAQLLCSSLNKHGRSNDHNGGLISSDQSMDDYYNKKNSTLDGKSSVAARLERTNKRSNTSSYEANTKRSRNEPKEKMSSELLQQLMSNNHHRGRPKGKSNWLLDSGGQKAACISQPSDSVLMNLLDAQRIGSRGKAGGDRLSLKSLEDSIKSRQNTIRKNSISLLDPNATEIPSLLDLSQQDFEVNAPVNSLLLQGADLLTALDISGPI